MLHRRVGRTVRRLAGWSVVVLVTTTIGGCGGSSNPEPKVDTSQASIQKGADVGAQLAALAPDVTSLDLSGSAVTDAQLGDVATHSTIKSLNLSGTGITDQGLSHLSGMTQLDYLDLRGTQITDAGVAQLQTLTNLSYLMLANTAVTPKTAYRLKGAIPNTNIDIVPAQ
ncbi:MAG: hypothetical protein GC159_20475 [Phycisphaera sp.]|nr:hypothetical protein [Phycisphaera sp.]